MVSHTREVEMCEKGLLRTDEIKKHCFFGRNMGARPSFPRFWWRTRSAQLRWRRALPVTIPFPSPGPQVPVKDQTVNISGFANHAASDAATSPQPLSQKKKKEKKQP